MENYRWRVTASLLGVLTAVILLTPNAFDTSKISWWPAQKKLNYGLDIQGGLHLVMGVDINGVMTETASRLANSIKKELSTAKEPVQMIDFKITNGDKGEITFDFPTALDVDKAEKFISDKHGVVLQVLNKTDKTLVVRYLENQLHETKAKVIAQSIETIRNRIDEFGVAEPSISQQGDNRILVQLPGMTDAENAKKLINTTAKLDFMIVNKDVNPVELQKWIQDAEKAGNYSMKTLKFSEYTQKINEDLKTKVPEKTVVYFGKNQNATNITAGSIAYALRTDTDLGGSSLDDAAINFGQFGEPEVALSFNALGAAKFSEITGNNIGNQMAIVLDKVVYSAPNIQTRIGNGQARITLGQSRDREASMAEAKMISMALKAGSLPASLEQLEERRVGPTLGADSIRNAQMGAYVGSLLVVLFMLIYYRAMGIVASVSLGVNILSVFGLLTAIGATLTLPGIAGIALTVGFAVDANVLIQERIKEELLKGASWKSAIKEGYHRAMSAILDSNITVAATGIILLYFGTGPVKGFAVTLLIGIVTTLFGNVFVSKVIVDTLIFKWNVKHLSIGLPTKTN
ncbi:MAG: protein translocase subunit SecD [Bdellovibrionaceae bacterium]|nr:protein translocase subunit SecD [Pseudobdellovibrionaceae bacterium]NUM58446.1 protein translocase subunit SecD [Pseudobdellovibrionaceae bacterium]